jgi:hypothetical protein
MFPAASSPTRYFQYDEGARHPAFQRPARHFYLREDSEKPMIMLAGGTGFAPIKAIVEHAIAEKMPAPDVHLLGRQGEGRSVPECLAGTMGGGTCPDQIHPGAFRTKP